MQGIESNFELWIGDINFLTAKTIVAISAGQAWTEEQVSLEDRVAKLILMDHAGAIIRE